MRLIRCDRGTADAPCRSRFWIHLGSGAVILFGVFHCWFRLSLVVGSSMAPNLATGDVLLVNRWAYRHAEPQRGDIVLARTPGGLIVKRVVGLPAEEVDVSQGRVRIDGEPLPEPYPVELGGLSIGRGRLAPGKYALLGDNRNLTEASVVHAIAGKDRILGKVIWSLRW